MFKSIKTKILVLQLELLISVALALGVGTYLIMFRSLKDSQRQNLEYIAMGVGEQLNTLIDNRHMSTIIDPLGNKRSGFYWYKNVEQKKVFKFQISFGFDKGVSYLTYPINIYNLENDILLRMNYFTIANSYKDLYLIPKKF